MELNNQELEYITGGATRYIVYGIIGGIVAFIIGAVDGYLRPIKCR